MNRNNRTVLVLAIAVLMAGIASFGVYRVIAGMPARQAVTTVDAVVAAHPLRLGTRITKDHVKLVSWPADSQVPGAYSKIEDVLERGVISPVSENEPLTDSKLAPIEAGAGLPPSIPDGMRALSVKVNEVVGVAGFVVPGTRVDVMATIASRKQDEQSTTRVVVSNVQVLTAGTRYDQEKAKDGEAIPSTVVTLLVTPEDAERVTLAATEGHLMLMLRNPLDVAPTETTGVRTAGLFGTQPSAPAPSKPVLGRRARPVAPIAAPPTPAPKAYTVEAIRGAKRTEEVIR